MCLYLIHYCQSRFTKYSVQHLSKSSRLSDQNSVYILYHLSDKFHVPHPSNPPWCYFETGNIIILSTEWLHIPHRACPNGEDNLEGNAFM